MQRALSVLKAVGGPRAGPRALACAKSVLQQWAGGGGAEEQLHRSCGLLCSVRAPARSPPARNAVSLWPPMLETGT